jgi:hypothetical protein
MKIFLQALGISPVLAKKVCHLIAEKWFERRETDVLSTTVYKQRSSQAQ